MKKFVIKKADLLEVILLDIGIAIDPDLVGINIEKVKGKKRKILERYYELLGSLSWALKKIARYESYFDHFYSSEIKDYEALEYHIHSYLQDLTLLKNKLEIFLNALNHDIINEAVKKDLLKIKTLIINQFEGVKRARDPHQHKGWRFIEGDIEKLRTLELIASTSGMENVRESNNAKELFLITKQHWTKQAKENSEEMSKMTNKLFLALKKDLYQLLELEEYTSNS